MKSNRIQARPSSPSNSTRSNHLYLVAGTIEPVLGGGGRFHNVEVLIGPRGDIIGKYRRTTPIGPWIYKAKSAHSMWDFDYKEAAELPVFENDFGTVGMLICSEVYMPELSRARALKGAELVFIPAGGTKCELWNA